jgi:mono/diheme cytochrome c family protein
MPFISRKSFTMLALLSGVAVVAAVGFVWSGVYNVGADDHHTKPVFALMQSLRENSIHARSKRLQPPNLDDPQLILKGAGQYAAMCTGCHLAPGMGDSEIRPGLYPQPPELAKTRLDPKDAFWVIKHGIKMSAMPAWGGSHDDATIWSMVAFLQKLPDMTPAQYADIVAKAPPDEDMEGGHHHGAGDDDEHAEGGMAGMDMPASAVDSHAHDEASNGAQDESTPHSHDAKPAEAVVSMEGMAPKAAPEAEAAAEAFHAALQKGDRTAVLALLAPEVTISEGGDTQTRDQYAAGHLGEDIAFLKSAQLKPLYLGSMPMGGTAMVGSRSEIHASHDGKPMVLLSSEMLYLKKTPAGWKITRIQWASEPQGK